MSAPWLSLSVAYVLMGAGFIGVGIASALDAAHPRRWGNAVFWALLGVLVAAADLLPAAVTGAAVLVLALLAGFGVIGRGPARATDTDPEAEAQRLGHALFRPALLLPLVTVGAALALPAITLAERPLVDPKQATLLGLTLACLLALADAHRLTGARPRLALEQTRGLLDAIGWAALLPLLLAVLGAVFTAAGVGDTLAGLVRAVVPADSRFLLVAVYALGMAGFTMIMGNAFAAFPVITAGIGLPLLVEGHGANAAPLAAIGMLAGYCGTLMTPMAANFNIVPVALLDLKDPYAVIRMQIGTAIPLLMVNILLLWWLALP
ncbi:MAG: DUF979 domain-containing protein [Xanthomonadales bacterium]|jgi:uncharacterized membrane protein|nr:DUF979 domain-containing protein [Xanthomonadales bacterium]